MENSDLTLVIPTYNRCDLFARSLQHMANSRWQSPIIVGDSSENGVWEKNEEIVRKYREVLRIEYIRDLPSTPISTKWTNVVSRVRSKFVVLCADDDLCVPETVRDSALFLEQNPSYTLCHGVYLAYNCRVGVDTSSGLTLGSDNYSDSMEQESASERLVALLSKYAATFYGVHRTESLCNILNRICEYLPASAVYGNLQELIQSSMVVIHGKVKRLPLLYSVRKGWPPTAGWETLLMRSDFSAHLGCARSCIVKALVEQESIEPGEAGLLFDVAFTRYLRRAIGPLPFSKRFQAYDATTFGSIQLDVPSIKLILEHAGSAFKNINALLPNGGIKLP